MYIHCCIIRLLPAQLGWLRISLIQKKRQLVNQIFVLTFLQTVKVKLTGLVYNYSLTLLSL